jgi:chorismate--pyruvate lyase
MTVFATSVFGSSWRPAAHWLRPSLPARLRPWLLDPASLTERIICSCRGAFRVQVLDQAWRRPLPSETQALALKPGRRAWVRQVRLFCDRSPWVYARTVIPPSTLTGAQRRLARLRSRSLGAVLFADPSMRRGPMEVARLAPGDALYALATRDLKKRPAEVWGRRAVFRLRDKPLLVSEMFLPDLGDFPAAR